MKLIFMRHGFAEKKQPDDSGLDDFERRLTREGIIEVKEIVQTGQFLFKNIDRIYTSPLVRAVQTAQILYTHHRKSDFEILPSLDSLSPLKNFQSDLKKIGSGTFCFVGHEPHLSHSINFLLNQRYESKISLSKGAIAVLEGPGLESLKITSIISPKIITKLEY